jgi:carbamoyl-phosphate synthase large subunit
MARKLLILGAGKYQVPIINKAKRMGFFTIVVSVIGDYPGFRLADKSYYIDIREKDKVLEIAEKEKICGVLTDQTDLSVPTVAYVAEKLKLPGIGYNCALRFTNKYLMRKLSQEIGIESPKHFQISSFKEFMELKSDLSFPIVAKPIDNQGSRGVIKINCSDEFQEKFYHAKSFSLSGKVIIEEYIRGREVVVEGFVSDFNFQNLIIGDRKYFDISDLFIPSQTIFPSNIAENLKKKIFYFNKKIINHFAPKFGITHSEFIVNEKNEDVYLVETAIRGGGVYISSDLIPLSCGINVNKKLINLASGQHAKILNKNISNLSAGYICFYLPEGIIRNVNGIEELKKLRNVKKGDIESAIVGRNVESIKDKTMRFGPILIAGKCRKSCENTIKRIQKVLNIDVETPKGIMGIQW